jgi:deoxycytidine triphosphate deaminase
MLFDAHAIKRLVDERIIVLTPWRDSHLKPASYVLSLDGRWRRWAQLKEPIHIWSSDAAAQHLLEIEEGEQLMLEPSAFVLGCSVEHISLPSNIAGFVSPLSHVARFGLGVTGSAD